MQHLSVSRDAWRQIFPNAPSAVIDAFAAKPTVLDAAGVTATRTRLAFFCANVEHECGGFTIHNLTENIMYTAARMVAVWPNRFGSAAAVQAKYGTGTGWQLRAFDDIYGNRMGNRHGSHDGSTFIGRGGPQVTGRDGYAAVGSRAGLDLVSNPSLASQFDMQPEICAAFWSWKNLNHFADANDFLGCVKSWNGGTNGLADRKVMMAGNNPIISRLLIVSDAIDAVNAIAAPAPAAIHPIGDVAWVQDSMNKLLRLDPSLDTDGRYGTKTHDAVLAFQKKTGLKPLDGIAGSTVTIPAIKAALAAEAGL